MSSSGILEASVITTFSPELEFCCIAETLPLTDEATLTKHNDSTQNNIKRID